MNERPKSKSILYDTLLQGQNNKKNCLGADFKLSHIESKFKKKKSTTYMF